MKSVLNGLIAFSIASFFLINGLTKQNVAQAIKQYEEPVIPKTYKKESVIKEVAEKASLLLIRHFKAIK